MRNIAARPANSFVVSGRVQAESSAQLDITLAKYYEIYASVVTFEDRIAQARKSAGVQPQQVEIVKSVEDKFQQDVHSGALPASSSPHIQAEVANSDLIVIGVPLKARTLPIEDRTFAFTQYEVRVEKVISGGQSNVVPGDAIVVSRGGGDLTVDNVLVKAIEPAFSEFCLNQSYILMLRSIPGTTTYRALGSGTFAVRNGEVSSASTFEKDKTPKRDLAHFMSEVDSAVARKRSGRN
ncbi:MAG: hypothetical protein ACXV7C_00775 [Candidatus Angelobacter sp.]